MKNISIHDAKTNLSKYIAAAKDGEKIYIGSFGKAEVQLVKIPDRDNISGKRNFKIGKTKVAARPDAFDASTDKAIANLMLGE